MGWQKGVQMGLPGVAFSDGDRHRLRAALDTGQSWHSASLATKIPYSTVKKHARLMGDTPRPAGSPKNHNGRG